MPLPPSLLDRRIDTEPERVQEVVDEVFANPAYRETVRPLEIPHTLIERAKAIFHDATEWFREIGEWMDDLYEASPALFFLLLAGLLLVLIALLTHIAYTLRITYSALRAAPRSEEEIEEEGRRQLYRELRDEAHARALRGEFAEGIRSLLLALFARYERDRPGLVPEGWTNHEVVDRLQVDEMDRGRLQELAFTVDRVWYGREAATEDEFRRAAGIVDSIARS